MIDSWSSHILHHFSILHSNFSCVKCSNWTHALAREADNTHTHLRAWSLICLTKTWLYYPHVRDMRLFATNKVCFNKHVVRQVIFIRPGRYSIGGDVEVRTQCHVVGAPGSPTECACACVRAFVILHSIPSMLSVMYTMTMSRPICLSVSLFSSSVLVCHLMSISSFATHVCLFSSMYLCTHVGTRCLYQKNHVYLSP